MTTIGITAIDSHEIQTTHIAHIVRPLALIGLISLFTTAAVAGDLAKSFAEAVARGDAQENAMATKDYFAKTLLPYYGRRYASVLQSCFATVPQPDNGRFSFVAAIAADGRVVRLYSDRQTNIFLCMRDTIEKEVFPAPPVSPYYLHIDMNFTDEVPPAHGSGAVAPPLVWEPNRYSYTFGVPGGWEFSFEQAQERGALLAFFPKGGSFGTSSNVIYVNEVEAPCGADCVSVLSSAIAKMIREAKDESPTVEVAVVSPIKTKEGGKAPVRILQGAKDPRQNNSKDNEALAFIAHDETIILVILTARDMKTWEQDYGAFQEIVSGHRFFNCKTPDLAVPCSQ